MESLRFTVAEQYGLLVHADRPPDAAEWQDYVVALSSQPLRGLLVFSDGASPNASQRKQLHEAIVAGGFGATTTAVITGALIARGVMTALSWFDITIRPFRPDQLDDALLFLDAPAQSHDAIAIAAARARAELAGRSAETMTAAEARLQLESAFAALRARR